MKKGFTIIELLISLAIISIVATSALSNFSDISKVEMKKEMKISAENIKTFIDKLFEKENQEDLEDLTTNGFKKVDENGNLYVDYLDKTFRFSTIKNSEIKIETDYCNETDLGYSFDIKNDNLNLHISYDSCTNTQPSFE